MVVIRNYQCKAKLINSTFELAKATAYRICVAVKLDLDSFNQLVKSKEKGLLEVVLRKDRADLKANTSLFNKMKSGMFYKAPAAKISALRKGNHLLSSRSRL